VIIIPIPAGTRFKVPILGRTRKLVRCKHCATDYSYIMERESAGFAERSSYRDDNQASMVAAQSAVEQIRRILARDLDLVSCPKCGCYQRNMLRRMRWRIFIWPLAIAICAPIIAVPLLMTLSMPRPAWNDRCSWIVLAAAALVVFSWVIIYLLWNPNLFASRRAAKSA
jgi:hypothetical protein